MSKTKSLNKIRHSFFEYFTLPSIISIVCIAGISFAFFCFANCYIEDVFEYDNADIINSLLQPTNVAIITPENQMFYFGIAVYLICGIVIGISQFSFLQNKAHKTAVLSFGEKRKRVFITRTVPVFITAFLVMIIGFLPLLLKNISGFGFTAALLTAFCSLVLAFFSIFTVGFTAGVVGSLLCAKTLETAAFSISVTVIPHLIEIILENISSRTLFGFLHESMAFSAVVKFIDPIYLFEMPDSSFSNTSENSYQYIFSLVTADSAHLPEMKLILISALYWIIISVIALTVGLVLFAKKYKPEKAIKSRNSYAELFFISAACLPAFFMIFMMNSNTSPKLSVLEFSSIIISAVITFAILMITYRDKAAIKKCAATVIIQGAVLAVLITVCASGGLGFCNRLPDTSKIERVEVYSSDLGSVIPSEYIDAYQVTSEGFSNPFLWQFKNSDEFEIIESINKSAVKNRVGNTDSSLKFTYILKNGNVVTRKYKNISDSAQKEILKLFDTATVKDSYKNLLTKGMVPTNANVMENSYIYEYAFLKDKATPEIFISRNDMSREYLNSLFDKESLKTVFTKLTEALAEDYSEMSYKEMYYPSENSICTITVLGDDKLNYSDELGYIDDSEGNIIQKEYDFIVYPSMKNTVNVLETEGLLKYCSDKLTPVSVKMFNVNDYLKAFSIDSEKQSAGLVFKSFELQNNDVSLLNNTVKEYTDKKEVTSIYSQCRNTGVVSEGSLIAVVKFSDGSFGAYFIYEGAQK